MIGEDHSRSTEAAARKWVVLLHSGRVDPAALRAFEAWLAQDERHARAYRDHEQCLADVGLADALNAEAPPVRVRRAAPPRWIAPLAAALVLAVALGATLAVVQAGPRPMQETQIAETRVVDLPDGSKVTLGARSRIHTHFTDKLRIVTLSEGEAFFEVASNPARPFYVQAGDRMVRVVGTKFDVSRAADLVKVSVVEGVVEVVRGADARKAEDSRPTLPKEILHRGDQVVARIGDEAVERTAVEPTKAASWRRGWLSYEDASLTEILADANRYTARQIVIASPELGDVRLTAAFGADQIDSFLDGLEGSHPVTVDRSDPERIVLRLHN